LKPYLFELELLWLLMCITFPFVLIGVHAFDFAQRWIGRRAIVLSASTTLCVAGAWFAILIY
jgi:hypothetical protein